MWISSMDGDLTIQSLMQKDNLESYTCYFMGLDPQTIEIDVGGMYNWFIS